MYLLWRVFPPPLLLLPFPPLPRHSLKKMNGSTIRFVAWKPEADLMLITIRVAWPRGWERWTSNPEASREVKYRPDRWLDLFKVVPSSNPRLRL